MYVAHDAETLYHNDWAKSTFGGVVERLFVTIGIDYRYRRPTV